MDYRAAIIVSCWFAVAAISAVYMWVFGNVISDIMFGVFLPVGLLVVVAVIVTFGVASSFESEKKANPKSPDRSKDLGAKLDSITKEIDQIKKEMEE